MRKSRATVRLVRIGTRFLLLALFGALSYAIVPAASSDVGQTQIVVPGGPGFLVETPDGTVTSSVASAPGTSPVNYSAAANGSIAYQDNNGGGVVGGIWLVNPAQPPLELDSSPQDSDVGISADGSKVAFTRFDPVTEASDLYVINANGSGLTLVASGGGNNYLGSPAFSPDGSTIAYDCRAANSTPGTGIGCGPTAAGTYVQGGVMLMNTDGSGKRVVLTALQGAQGDSISWSPDGRSIAMSGCVTSVVDGVYSCGPPQVFVYHSDGSDVLMGNEPARQITSETGPAASDPQFTPDGSAIVFAKVVDNHWGLYRINTDGTNEQALSPPTPGRFAVVPPATGGGPPPTVNSIQPVPSPDGTVVVPSWIRQCQGYLAETAAAAYTTCIPGHGRTGFFSNTSISVASDDSIVYSDLSAGPAGADGPIWLSRPNTAPVELDSNVYDFDPTISADGSLVAFAREAPASGEISGGSDIYTIHADGTDLKLVASGTGASGMDLSNPTLSPDGSAIAYVCSSIDHSYAETNKFCGPLFDGTFRAGGLMLMNADGSDKRMIVTSGVGSDLSWSPDGQWLATAGGSVGGGNPQVFAYRTDGSDLFMGGTSIRQITHETQPGGAWDPQFSRDGSQVMYQMNSDDNGDSSAGSYSYEIGRDGTSRHEVFLAPPYLGQGVPGLFVPQASGPRGAFPIVAPTQVPVPDVRRLTFRAAKARLAPWRLVAKVTRRTYSSIPYGRVISQSPGANKDARLGPNGAPTVVKLVISRGRRPRHHHR
jgi:Tol biopolymer transport system component